MIAATRWKNCFLRTSLLVKMLYDKDLNVKKILMVQKCKKNAG